MIFLRHHNMSLNINKLGWLILSIRFKVVEIAFKCRLLCWPLYWAFTSNSGNSSYTKVICLVQKKIEKNLINLKIKIIMKATSELKVQLLQ